MKRGGNESLLILSFGNITHLSRRQREREIERDFTTPQRRNEGHEENVVQCNCTIHMKFTDFFHYANFFSVAKEICIFLK